MIGVEILNQVAEKRRVKQFIKDVAADLKITRFYSKEIRVEFFKELKCGKEPVYGFADYDKYTGEVIIEIARTYNNKKLSLEFKMKTLAHELVHAKQYLRGELDPYKDTWKGADCGKWKGVEYSEEPWEYEAHELENPLFDKHWLGKDNG